jgi:hypothetical protein
MQLDLTEICRISKGHGSFAVWRDSDIDDLSIIKERQSELHGRVVFVGYNASGEICPLQNFHKTHTGGRDKWLAETIGGHSRLRGAYMTDFFKGDHAPRESGVIRDEMSIRKNLVVLNHEIAFFEPEKPVLVAFGDKTFDLLRDLGFSSLLCLPHYARRGITRAEFERAVKRLGERVHQ